MKIRQKSNGEILHAVYMTWTESEFPKDGEKFMLLVGASPMPTRPAQPYVIVPTRPDLVIRPEDSSAFMLVSTTETGRVNLEADGFQFAPAEGGRPETDIAPERGDSLGSSQGAP